jgi:hypothetical protein
LSDEEGCVDQMHRALDAEVIRGRYFINQEELRNGAEEN